MKRIVYACISLLCIASGCGTPNTQVSVEYEPNPNQLSLSSIPQITVEKLHYGSKVPIESKTVKGPILQAIIHSIKTSQLPFYHLMPN